MYVCVCVWRMYQFKYHCINIRKNRLSENTSNPHFFLSIFLSLFKFIFGRNAGMHLEIGKKYLRISSLPLFCFCFGFLFCFVCSCFVFVYVFSCFRICFFVFFLFCFCLIFPMEICSTETVSAFLTLAIPCTFDRRTTKLLLLILLKITHVET